MKPVSYELKNSQIKHINVDEIVFIKLAAKGAMGEPGCVMIVSKSGNEIKSGRANFLTGHYKLAKLGEFFPPVKAFLEDGSTPDGWGRVNLGAGNTLFVRGDYLERFQERFSGKFEDEINMYWHDAAIELLSE